MASYNLKKIRGGTPLYTQLKEILLEQIRSGVYQPGQQLPPEHELLKTYQVSRITVRQALEDLVSSGVLYKTQGKGTFVSQPKIQQSLIRLTDFVEDMQRAGLTPSAQVLKQVQLPAPVEVAAVLEIAPGTPVFLLERRRFADNAPISHDLTYLPMEYAALLRSADLERQTIYSILEEQYGISVAFGEYLIEAVPASIATARALDIGGSAAVLLIQRSSYTADRRPIYHQYRYYRADRVRYRISLQRSPEPKNSHTILELLPVFT